MEMRKFLPGLLNVGYTWFRNGKFTRNAKEIYGKALADLELAQETRMSIILRHREL